MVEFFLYGCMTHLNGKDICPTSAIGIIPCDHTHPTPAKMLDKLYQCIHLQGDREIEKQKVLHVLEIKMWTHFHERLRNIVSNLKECRLPLTWKKSLGMVLKKAGNSFLSLRQAQLEK